MGEVFIRYEQGDNVGVVKRGILGNNFNSEHIDWRKGFDHEYTWQQERNVVVNLLNGQKSTSTSLFEVLTSSR